MVAYIAGSITNNMKGYRYNFSDVEMVFNEIGYSVLNPSCLPVGLNSWEDYMKISNEMLEVSDVVVFLADWKKSKGAKIEHERAKELKKRIIYYNRRELVDELLRKIKEKT